MCVGHSYNLGILWDSVVMWCYVCVCGLCVWDILIVEMGNGKLVKIREVPEMSEGWRGRGWV